MMELKTTKQGIEFLLISPGSFLQGNEFPSIDDFWREIIHQGYTDAKREWYTREFPRHEVHITKPFFMSRYPVTHEQFFTFIDATGYMPDVDRQHRLQIWNQASHRWDDRTLSAHEKLREICYAEPNVPVRGVSWVDAVAFLSWLSATNGAQYSLPTEAEWEYCARAGSDETFPFPIIEKCWEKSPVDFAWYVRNSNMQPHTVGLKRPNRFGLYDMIGNVWEWCLDPFDENEYQSRVPPCNDPVSTVSGTKRTLKGGSYMDSARSLRPADRFGFEMDQAGMDTGFRCVLQL